MRIRRWWRIAAALGPMASASILAAQVSTPAHFASWHVDASVPRHLASVPDSSRPGANASGMVLGGITGMFVGFFAGAAIGAAASGGGEDDLGAAVLGGLLVATVTTPVGVHLGNHGRGRLADDLLISALIGGVGIALATGTDEGGWLLMLPIGQIIGSTWTEVRSMPPAAAPRRFTLISSSLLERRLTSR